MNMYIHSLLAHPLTSFKSSLKCFFCYKIILLHFVVLFLLFDIKTIVFQFKQKVKEQLCVKYDLNHLKMKWFDFLC